MTDRRAFLTGLAATLGATAAGPALAYDVPEKHMPRIIRVSPRFRPNELHVDPNSFYLYWVYEPGLAIRYTVGVGRANLYESGEFKVGRKAEWPSWKPTPQMIQREPEKYEKYADGVPGGPTNPLGARALYLYNERGFDTALRIHGTPQPWTVARAVSNGCARLVNDHIIDLYARVPVGSRVLLHPKVSLAA